jgi:hypothetical protein
MRILDLGEAGYEGQSEAQKHYFQIDGDIDQERGINDTDCDQITKQLVGMGLQAHCQPDESRHNVVQIDTYSGHTTIADALAQAGYEADAVGDPSGFKFHEGEANIVAETPNKFTKADFDDNEDKNYHTENGVELAKAFGTPEEVEQMEQIAKNHYARGHILPDEIEARNGVVSKYFPALESQEEAMAKVSEGDLGPGDIELLKPMVDMDPKVLKIYARNIIKKYPHMKDNVMRLLPTNEGLTNQSPEDILSKYPQEWEQLKQGADVMDFDKLYDELYAYFADEMPYGTQKARDGDPYQWINDELDHLGLLEGDGRKKGIHGKGHPMRQKQQAAIHANEDVEDETKIIRLQMMQKELEDLKSNFEILMRLDQRGTGAGDLHDQLTTMNDSIKSLEAVLGRSLKVVPGAVQEEEFEPHMMYDPKTGKGIMTKKEQDHLDLKDKGWGHDKPKDVKETDDRGMNKYGLSATNVGGKFRSYQHGKLTGEFDSMEELAKHQQGLLDNVEESKTKNCGCGQDPCITYGEQEVNEFDIKKSFNTVANNVKQSLSSVVGQNPLRAKMNKNANKNGPSIAKQINWGGKYESEDLNELDLFAPKTDYIKGPAGEYYKIEYRNNSGMTGHRKDDKARFVAINPASDKEVQALSLDDMISKGDARIHQGHDHQGGLPTSDPDISVYAYGGDDYEENIPNNAKMKLIKIMTTESDKKKKSELGTKIRSWRETKADMKKKIEASKPGDKK